MGARAVVVYKIPYRRARAWPCGRVRRASKGILHTRAVDIRLRTVIVTSLDLLDESSLIKFSISDG